MRMLKKLWIVMFAALGVFAGASVSADASYREQMKGLDEQVQEIKSDVLGIAAELARLEERLLYPSNTHLAVFVALAERDTLRLDAVQIQIDGQLVAHTSTASRSSRRCRRAACSGSTPATSRPASTRSKSRSPASSTRGKEYSRTEHFAFTKGVEPKLLGVTLGSAAAAARRLVTACRARLS